MFEFHAIAAIGQRLWKPGEAPCVLSPCGEVLSGERTLERERGLRDGWAGTEPVSGTPDYHAGHALGKQGRAKKGGGA